MSTTVQRLNLVISGFIPKGHIMMRLQAKGRLYICLMVLAAFAITASFGCRPGKQSKTQEPVTESDRARQTLESRIKDNRDTAGRAKMALAKLNDGVPDHVPFLVSVNLGCTEEKRPMLFLTCLDQDRDLHGIQVREERADPSGGTTILEENYPVCIMWPETPMLMVTMYPVELRSPGQRKDEYAWKDYTIAVLEDLARKFVYEGPIHEAVKLAPKEALTRKMPPIWMSLPDANGVRVFVSAYDRQGERSDAIEVRISPQVRGLLKQPGE